MVTNSLTPDLINDGVALVRELDSSVSPVNGALWLFSDQNFWKLLLALSDRENAGPKAAYAKVQKALSKLPDDHRLSLDDVVITKPDAPLLKLLRTAVRTGPGISGIRLTGNVINGRLIQDAYIYRLQ
jgi:hypothetical protein